MKRLPVMSLVALAALAAAWSMASSRVNEAARSPQRANRPCGEVTVAAASDLTYAMNEIAANFEKETGCSVKVSYGSSGNFLTQIENGAPFDVFFSADIAYPKKLEAEGLAAPESTYLYAIGKIVLWTPKDSNLELAKGLGVLRDPSVKKISIANPAHAPYGRAAEEALRKAGVYDVVKDRLVLGENISQAAQFVQSGNADAGIIALSLAASPTMKGDGRYEKIPDDLYTPIEQGAVVTRAASNPKGARMLLDFTKISATAEIFDRFGFTLPPKNRGGGNR